MVERRVISAHLALPSTARRHHTGGVPDHFPLVTRWRFGALCTLVLVLSAAISSPAGDSQAAPSPLPTRARIPLIVCDSCLGSATFRPPLVDYANPAAFLASGPQSTLLQPTVAAIDAEIPGTPTGLSGIGRVHTWMASSFQAVNLGGATIGQTDVNDLIDSRELGGCHDWALVMTAVLRHFGYPSLMVDTAGLTWAKEYAAGRTQAFAGHVFAEVFVDGKWILVDCTSGNLTHGYDPLSQVIGYHGAGDPVGFFALFKGLDPESYGVTNGDILRDRMAEFAGALSQLTIVVPEYQWGPLPR